MKQKLSFLLTALSIVMSPSPIVLSPDLKLAFTI